MTWAKLRNDQKTKKLLKHYGLMPVFQGGRAIAK